MFIYVFICLYVSIYLYVYMFGFRLLQVAAMPGRKRAACTDPSELERAAAEAEDVGGVEEFSLRACI